MKKITEDQLRKIHEITLMQWRDYTKQLAMSDLNDDNVWDEAIKKIDEIKKQYTDHRYRKYVERILLADLNLIQDLSCDYMGEMK